MSTFTNPKSNEPKSFPEPSLIEVIFVLLLLTWLMVGVLVFSLPYAFGKAPLSHPLFALATVVFALGYARFRRIFPVSQIIFTISIMDLVAFTTLDTVYFFTRSPAAVSIALYPLLVLAFLVMLFGLIRSRAH